jgi:hypothetical protein
VFARAVKDPVLHFVQVNVTPSSADVEIEALRKLPAGQVVPSMHESMLAEGPFLRGLVVFPAGQASQVEVAVREGLYVPTSQRTHLLSEFKK